VRVSEAQRIRAVVIGAGGHARVVLDALAECSDLELCGVVDPGDPRETTAAFALPHLGGDEILPTLRERGITHFAVGLGGTRDNRPRRALHERGLSAGLEPLQVIHPAAIVSRRAVLGAGIAVLAGAVINAGASLADGALVNTGALVEHDCQLAAFAHLATGARLAGGVRIGALAHIGAGAVVLQGVSIGEAAIVGAGAVVLEDVAAAEVVVGSPARVVRRGGS
jgi:UDP-perosamine 4-acetyltransferase